MGATGQTRAGILEGQEFLLETQPDIYYITDHYVGWPTVLARLSALRVPEARLRLERAYVAKAPPTLLKKRAAAAAAKPKSSRRRG